MSKRFEAVDYLPISEREVTPEGYLIASGRLARTGVQFYRAYELGLEQNGSDPMKMIAVHRPDEEVFDPESMASFDGAPVTIEHPEEGVFADNWKKHAVGEAKKIQRDGNFLRGTLVVRDKKAIDAIQSGKTQISNGYTFELDLTPGKTSDGEEYDAIQRKIRGNHVAIVSSARCGPACRIADSTTEEETKMPEALRKIVVDGLPLEVSDTAAAVIEKLQKKATDAETQVAELQKAQTTTAEKHAGELKAKDAEIAELKKDVITPADRDKLVGDWAKMIADAKVLVPNLVTDGKTCLAIRREVIATVSDNNPVAKAVADAVLSGQKLEEIDADKARATFNAIVVAVKPAEAQTSVADALLGNDAHKQEKKAVGRDAFINNLSNAWNTKQEA